ncbi:MAG: hypothetical protein K0Q49_308 [Haloplasmataceae bacterium]|jgi:basic membrane protein A|nr:hypothetical protein [Haloplasmataceae bacterium]
MRKLFALFSVFVLFTVLTACGPKLDYDKGTFTGPYCDDLDVFADAKKAAIGMVTDSGTIDDKSFNQGTWEGIQCYNAKHTSAVKYLQPSGETKEDYINAIDNLVDAGYKMIVAPGFKFENAIFEAQTTHEDIKFIIIDGAPHSGNYVPDIKSNTVSVMFAEEQVGFLAGVAAALQTETGKVAFVGGMEIPAVQKFGWGYVAGVAYANDTYDLNVVVTDYLYQGTFTEVTAGQTIAAGMYDEGIDIIFAAAGGVGVGVINEAKTRTEAGEEVWVIGVDSDQYDAGKYGTAGKSVILTSAMKRVDLAAYNYSGALATNSFVGGKQVTYDIKNDGVGLPANNPNLAADTLTKVDTVVAAMKADTIVAPNTKEKLTTYLTSKGYVTPGTITY